MRVTTVCTPIMVEWSLTWTCGSGWSARSCMSAKTIDSFIWSLCQIERNYKQRSIARTYTDDFTPQIQPIVDIFPRPLRVRKLWKFCKSVSSVGSNDQCNSGACELEFESGKSGRRLKPVNGRLLWLIEQFFLTTDTRDPGYLLQVDL